MFDGTSVSAVLVECGVTHVVWIPDSVTGAWDAALNSCQSLQLIRVCREGEAFAVAAGLYLGGKRPVVQIQCTGMFEAGDALRNFIHDFKVPLFLLVGLRNYYASRAGKSADSAPRFAEAILHGWKVPFRIFEHEASVADLRDAYLEAWQAKRAAAVFLAE